MCVCVPGPVCHTHNGGRMLFLPHENFAYIQGVCVCVFCLLVHTTHVFSPLDQSSVSQHSIDASFLLFLPPSEQRKRALSSPVLPSIRDFAHVSIHAVHSMTQQSPNTHQESLRVGVCVSCGSCYHPVDASTRGTAVALLLLLPGRRRCCHVDVGGR